MMERRLVLFYSWSGHTRRAARRIAERTGADLAELRVETDYPGDYQSTLDRARREIEEKLRPRLCPLALDWDRYETVFLGTPNWYGTVAPPVFSFLHQVMPFDKNIVPFCTHGGGGAGRIAQEIARYCIGCDMLPMLVLRDGSTASLDESIGPWLKRVELIVDLLTSERPG